MKTINKKNRQKEYIVEEVKQMKYLNGDKNNVEYLVKWLDYPEEQNSWEPISHFKNCLDLIN